MNLSRSCLWLSLCGVLLACHRDYDSPVLGLRYRPPSGTKLVEEHPGPPAVAKFQGGLRLVRVDAPLPQPSTLQVPEQVASALAQAGAPLGGTLLSGRTGSLPIGPVVRYELDADSARSLVYLVPRASRFYLVALTARTQAYGGLSARVEQSLSSLSER